MASPVPQASLMDLKPEVIGHTEITNCGQLIQAEESEWRILVEIPCVISEGLIFHDEAIKVWSLEFAVGMIANFYLNSPCGKSRLCSSNGTN